MISVWFIFLWYATDQEKNPKQNKNRLAGLSVMQAKQIPHLAKSKWEKPSIKQRDFNFNTCTYILNIFLSWMILSIWYL